jgi:hypothetical protein
MRKLLVPAILLGGCVHLAPFAPVIPAQAVRDDPRSATAEAAGVRMTVHVGDWSGWPEDLDDFATPVEVQIENGSGRELQLRHPLFALLVPSGFRYDALSPREVRRLLRGLAYGYAGPGGWYYGAWGVYPWPGPLMPWPDAYPWFAWGPPPPPPTPAPLPNGRLAPGGRVSLLVFFPVPATRLERCAFEADLVASDGTRLGRIQVPFERRAAAPVAAGPILPPPPPGPPASTPTPPAPPAPPAAAPAAPSPPEAPPAK